MIKTLQTLYTAGSWESERQMSPNQHQNEIQKMTRKVIRIQLFFDMTALTTMYSGLRLLGANTRCRKEYSLKQNEYSKWQD